jgi:probable rRNA maturation factor
MNNLEIYKLKNDYKIPERELRKILKKAEKILKAKNLKISLAIVDDKTIRQLNKKYGFRDKATDVLSFELGDPHFFSPCFRKAKIGQPPHSPPISPKAKQGGFRGGGEIVISYSEAKRQARECKESLQKVITRLFVHGLLHILGHKHQTVKEREKMIQMELKILK